MHLLISFEVNGLSMVKKVLTLLFSTGWSAKDR